MPILDDLAALRAENARLMALLDAHGIDWRVPPEATKPQVVEPSRLSKNEKIALFRKLFRGRTDVYPVRWESNLHHVQAGQNFNSLGVLEVPEQAIIELLVNALIHRDYFTSASIRLLILADRIEIISPGHLPDNLSTAQIRKGKSNRRNPTLTDHAVKILPYRGIGTGIPRVLEDWPETRLLDDVEGNEFRAVIPRPTTPEVTPEVTRRVTTEVEAIPPARLLAIQSREAELNRHPSATNTRPARGSGRAFSGAVRVRGRLVFKVAERVGFEPTVTSLPRRFSRPVP